MDDLYTEKIQLELLDFATDKRKEWETDHFLYSVIFELTPKCNFNCIHCYLKDHHVSRELSKEKIIEIIDILYEREVLFLTFTGGEIFARSDFLDIYLYAKRKGFIIELYSNGFGITDEAIEMFRKYPPLLVDISLYGSCESTYENVTGVKGAYNKVVENIGKLVNSGIRVSLKAPVLNVYYKELGAMKGIAENFGLPFRTGFEIFPSVDNDNSVQQYGVSLKDCLRYEFSQFDNKPRIYVEDSEAEIIDLVKDCPLFRCRLGRASCAIDYEGRLLPCMSFRHAGKAFDSGSFDGIWKSFSEYPKMKASEGYRCLYCEAYDYCDICPAMMQFVHGDLEYVDKHFCQSAKARYAFYEKGENAEKAIDSNVVE